MGRLIIHIGTHKTGTTSIQRTLDLNRKKLLNRGIRYPDYAAIGHRTHYAHLGVVNALAGEQHKISQEQARQYFQHVASTLDEADLTLLSAESLYRHHAKRRDDGGRDAASYWQARSQFVEQFRELVGPAEIVIVVRRQCDFAESMYQEHVKVTRYTKSFERFLEDFWFHFEYYDQIKIWQKYFGEVKVIKFDDIKGKAITRRFLLRAGLKPGRFEEAGLVNVGIAPDIVLFKRWLNDSYLSKDQMKDVLQLISEAPTERLALPDGPRHLFAGNEHRARFQEKFSDANRTIVQEFFGGEGELFAPVAAGVDETCFGDDMDPQICRLAVAALVDRLVP